MDRFWDTTQTDAALERLGFAARPTGEPRFALSGFQPERVPQVVGFGAERQPGALSGFSGYDPFAPRGYLQTIAANAAKQQAYFDRQMAAAMPPPGQTTGQPTGPATGGQPTTLGGEWAGVDQWNALIQQAANQFGVPANLIKAVMKLESGGDASTHSPAGAIGLMQVMPFHFSGGENPWDPWTNISKGVGYLKEQYDRYGSWDLATMAYFGGNPYNPGSDFYGTTTSSYWTRVGDYWDQLNAAASGLAGIGAGIGGGGVNLAMVWGGTNAPITQEFGPTDFSAGNPLYNYGADYGVTGHTGLDVGLNPGSQLFAPAAGTVTVAGGTEYYTDDRYGVFVPGTGELRLRLDNGDEVILGHMQQITVAVGQRVNAGTYVGLSGTNNGGHVHVEYRTPDPSTASGWRIVDPRTALGGTWAGGPTPGMSSPTTTPQPGGFQGYGSLNDWWLGTQVRW